MQSSPYATVQKVTPTYHRVILKVGLLVFSALWGFSILILVNIIQVFPESETSH